MVSSAMAMHRPHLRLLGSLVLFGLFLQGCGGDKGPARRVLLITLDTVRADALACYGSPLKSADTPHLDALAAQGTLFQRTTCQIPATLTSHTAILSGRLPRSTGVRFAADRVPDDVVTLAEVCKDSGFTTAAFISASVLNQPFGLDQGFDLYEDVGSGGLIEDADRPGNLITDSALAWLREREPDEPFLLWVHYYDAHSPYKPDAEYDVYGPEGYDGPITGSADQVTRFVASKGAEVNARDLERLRALYLGEVAMVDGEVGRLLTAFDKANLNSKQASMVVAVGDHGENLGEGGRYFHGADLFETCMRVPLLVRWPGGAHAGTNVGDLVMGMDVMPTIASACALPFPENVDGMDLRAYLSSSKKDAPEERVGLLETEHRYRGDADKDLGVSTQRWKLIDRRKHRREPIFVGRALRAPLREPCYLRAAVQGDETVAIAAHIRYHTAATAKSTDPAVLGNQPTIMVQSSRFGIEAIHTQYDIPQLPEGWTAIATTDLYERAVSYGRAQGWPLQHIEIESIAVDVGGVPGQWKVDAYVDDVALVGAKTVVLDDFETARAVPYQDSGVGTKHAAGSRVERGKGLNGGSALRVVAQFPVKEENIWKGSELYHYTTPEHPTEKENLLAEQKKDAIPDHAKEMGALIDRWLEQPPPPPVTPAVVDPALEEALRSLGYS